MANSILAKMTVQIAANTAAFNQSLKDTSNKIDSFSKNISMMSKSLVGVFSVSAIASAGFEISKLAGEAEGVRVAFDKLPNSIDLMNKLKDATAGTVSELDLMKRAVMASNFGISLEALPQLLEFASVRAKQTGQSVDYLVDSIVTGIGRKSKLILDNLGISAVQLTEALGGASTAAASIEDVANAVGAIAEKELEKMGSMSENASTKIERLEASWINLKVAIGNAANGTGVLGAAIDSLTLSVDTAASGNLNFWEKLAFFVSGSGVKASLIIKDIAENSKKAAEEQSKHALVVKEVDRAMASPNVEAYLKAMQSNVNFAAIMVEYNKRLIDNEKQRGLQIENIANLTEKLNLLNADQLTLTGSQLIATNQEIKATEEKIKKLKELGVEILKNNELSKFTDEENRMGRINAQGEFLGYSDKKSLELTPSFDTTAIDSMRSAYDQLSESLIRYNQVQQINNERMMQARESWASFGSVMSDSIANVISANESLGKSLAKVASRVIDQLEQITLARMIADSSKYGIAGILAAAAGFGVIKGLFAKISKGSDGVTSSAFNTYRMQPIGINVYSRQRGTDLVSVGFEENRMRKRTRG